MAEMKFVCIIPARYASTRFPGKPLALIGGKTMICRVVEQAQKVLDDVYVATDDQRIYDAVKSFGGKVVMTSSLHPSGTDRCYEAYTQLQQEFDVIINIQGDEPFIQPAQIQALKDVFLQKDVEIATLVRKITADDGFEYLNNPNHPKVVINNNNEALYFSRSVIPYLRNQAPATWLDKHEYYSHVGVYAYRSQVLKDIVSLQPSSLELAESLEQLRWIQLGYRISVGFTTERSVGIDTPDDLIRAEQLI